jgi:hypothetical protein
MQKLRIAAEVARTLSERERTLCLHVVDYCTGARQDVPGVYEGEKKPRDRELPPPPEDVAEAAALATSSPKR